MSIKSLVIFIVLAVTLIIGVNSSAQSILSSKLTICEDDTFYLFLSTSTPSSSSFQWQESNDGVAWSNVSNNSLYLGASDDTLNLRNVSNSLIIN